VDDAKSVVRKYIIGTRSRHGKIASITIEEEPKGPDDKGVWIVKGTFVTERRFYCRRYVPGRSNDDPTTRSQKWESPLKIRPVN